MKMRTKLSIADCQARLCSATDLRGLALSWNGAGAGAVVGEFRGPLFRLHTKKYYSNSFAPFFYGKLTEAEGGTVLEGGFHLHPFIRLFMVFWYAFLLVFAAGALIVPASAHPAIAIGRDCFYAVLASLAVLGVGLIQFGKWLARGERETIHSFLKSTLEAGDE